MRPNDMKKTLVCFQVLQNMIVYFPSAQMNAWALKNGLNGQTEGRILKKMVQDGRKKLEPIFLKKSYFEHSIFPVFHRVFFR